jgi:predicted PurR-regulated permease PerM
MQPTSRLFGFVLRMALVIGVIVILYYGKGLLVLLVVAGLLAILLDPIDTTLREWGWKPGFAIAGAMFVLLLVFAGIFFAVGKQAARFADNWGEIEQRLSDQLERARAQIPMLPGGSGQDTTSVSGIQDQRDDAGSSIFSELPIGTSQVTGVLSSTLSILGDFLLMLVYVVLFLSQKERLREFVLRRAPDERRGETHETINRTLQVAQKYLKGRLILILILTVCYTVGFMISGVNYAIVVSLLAAILSIIPYLGNIIGGLLAMAIAIASGGGSSVILGILGTMAVTQMLESYILLPLIVGDEVDINPLTTIVAVIGFTVMWGPMGAIIAIPVVAMLRIVLKHIRGMEDYAYLLGQE